MKTIYLDDITNAVKEVTNCDLTIGGPGKRTWTDARRIYAALARKHTSNSISRIGNFIHRDHASVLHYEATALGFLNTDKQFTRTFRQAEVILLKQQFKFRKQTLLQNLNEFYNIFKHESDCLIPQIKAIVQPSNIQS